MSRNREYVYVCMAESFFFTLILYTLLTGVCSSSSDCTGLTRWVLNIQALLLLCTILVQIIILSIRTTQTVDVFDPIDSAAPTADVVHISNATSPIVLNDSDKKPISSVSRPWDDRYLMNISIAYCTSVFTCMFIYLVVLLQATTFNYLVSNIMNYCSSNGCMLINSSNVTYQSTHQTNWKLFTFGGSSWQISSDGIYVVDSSYLPMAGSIICATVLAYLIVSVFISMYMSHCATPMGLHNPLFMERRALAILNMIVSNRIPYIVSSVYSNCEWSISNILPILYILLVCYEHDLSVFIFGLFRKSKTLQSVGIRSEAIQFCSIACFPLIITLIEYVSNQPGYTLFMLLTSLVLTIICIFNTAITYLLQPSIISTVNSINENMFKVSILSI
jgi:hypothetical protein